MVSYAPFLCKYLRSLHQKFSGVKEGSVADYIPELTKANPDWFGIALVTVDGHVYQEGDSREQFTIQSISKPFVFGIALEDRGMDAISKIVNTEPTGEAFNQISLEPKSGRPRNPMINAGAIAMSGAVAGRTSDERIAHILEKFSLFTGRALDIDNAVFESEKTTGHRNRAIAHMLLNAGMIDGTPDEVLDVYFKQCSVMVGSRDLAVMAATLANQGVNPITGVRAVDADIVPKVLSVMATCGMYDGSGEWMYDIGLPAKSGVGGGILAVYPGKFGMAVFSPLLDGHGNSVRGIRVFQQISQDLKLHTLNSERFTTSSVIRAAYTGAQIRSKRVRGKEQGNVLDLQGERVHVLDLSGDMMFAAAEVAASNVYSRLQAASYIILDFRHISSMDTTAAQLIVWLAEDMRDEGKHLYLTGTEDKYAVAKYIKQHTSKEHADLLLRFEDVDGALEWCEDQVLAEAGIGAHDSLEVEFFNHLLCQHMNDEEKHYLRGLVNVRTYEPGSYICKDGDPGQELYFMVKGSVSVNLKVANGKYQCVAKISGGGAFGEQAILENSRRSADILAESDVTCMELNVSRFLEETSVLARCVHMKLLSNIAVDLSHKLRLANREIRYLTA